MFVVTVIVVLARASCMKHEHAFDAAADGMLSLSTRSSGGSRRAAKRLGAFGKVEVWVTVELTPW